MGLERERPGTMRGQEAAEGEGRGVSGDQRTQAGCGASRMTFWLRGWMMVTPFAGMVVTQEEHQVA